MSSAHSSSILGSKSSIISNWLRPHLSPLIYLSEQNQHYPLSIFCWISAGLSFLIGKVLARGTVCGLTSIVWGLVFIASLRKLDFILVILVSNCIEMAMASCTVAGLSHFTSNFNSRLSPTKKQLLSNIRPKSLVLLAKRQNSTIYSQRVPVYWSLNSDSALSSNFDELNSLQKALVKSSQCKVVLT